MATYFWLSFADPYKSKGTQFLGALVIEGSSFMAAVKSSHVMGLNPGGEVQGLAFQMSDSQGRELIEKWKNKLLSKAECVELDSLMAGHVSAVEE